MTRFGATRRRRRLCSARWTPSNPLTKRSARANQALPALERDVSALQQRATDIRALRDRWRMHALSPLKQGSRASRAATDAFVQSPAFQQYRASIERSQQAYDQAVDESMTDLHADDSFFELEVYLWQAEDDVERLRALPYSVENQQKLAEASQDMMSLRNELSQLEEQAMRSNAIAESARRDIAAAMDAQRIAMSKFERSRDASPAVADAIAALDTERARSNVVARDLADSETAAASVQRDFARASADANAAPTRSRGPIPTSGDCAMKSRTPHRTSMPRGSSATGQTA